MEIVKMLSDRGWTETISYRENPRWAAEVFGPLKNHYYIHIFHLEKLFNKRPPAASSGPAQVEQGQS